MRIDPKQLRYLRAIIEHRTFARAAEVLGLSQPALSRSISELERETGTRLLDRGRQGATPTVFGQALAARSVAIDAELRHAQEDVDRLKSAKAGQIVIGTTMVPSASVTPRAVSALVRERPGLVVKVVEYFEYDLLMAVRLGDVDLMIGPTYKTAQPDDLVEQPLFHSSVAVITRKSHRLARRRRLRIADLVHENWVGTITATSLQRYVDTLIGNAGVPPLRKTLQSDALPVLKALVANTDHFALLPPEVVSSDIAAGILQATPLDAVGNIWPHGYRLHPDKMQDPSIRAFIGHLTRVCAGDA